MRRLPLLALALLLGIVLPAWSGEPPDKAKQLRAEAYNLPDSLKEPARWREAVAQRTEFLKKLQDAIKADPALEKPLARTLRETEQSVACDGVDVSSMNRRSARPTLDPDLDVMAWLEEDHPYIAVLNSSQARKQLRLSLRQSERGKRAVEEWPAVASTDVEAAPHEIAVVHFDGIPTSGTGQREMPESFALCSALLKDGKEARFVALAVHGVDGWSGWSGWSGEASRYLVEPGEITIEIPSPDAFRYDEQYTIYAPKQAATRLGKATIPIALVDKEGVIEAEHGYFITNRALMLKLQLPQTDAADLVMMPDCLARVLGGDIIMDEQQSGPALLLVGKNAQVRRLTVALPEKNRLDREPLSDEPTTRIAQLIPRFRTDLWHIRAHAEQQIAAIGQPAIPKMIELLSVVGNEDGANDDRRSAARVLVLLGDLAVDDAAKLLTEQNRDIRRDAARVLQRIGDRGADVLLEAAKGADADIRRTALGALESSKDPRRRDAFLQALTADDPGLRREALSGLFRVGDKESREAIARCIGDPDPEVRRSALSWIGELHATEFAAQVIAAAQDPDAEVREAAVRTVGSFGVPEGATVVIAATSDPKRNVRRTASWSLFSQREMQGVGEQNMGLIVPLIYDVEHDVRSPATHGLVRLKTELAVDYLLRALEDPDQDIRLDASKGLTELGYRTQSRPNPPQPEGIRPRVRYGGPDTDLLYTLEPNDVPPLPDGLAGLIEALAAKDYFTRRAACEALAARGEEAIPALTKALGDPRRLSQWWAIKTLGQIDRPAARAALIPLLSSDDRLMAIASLDALSGSPDEALLPTWAKLLASDDFYTRMRAAEALGRIGSKECVPALLKQLDDPRSEVRQKAIWALGVLRDPATLEPLFQRFANVQGEKPNQRSFYKDYDEYEADADALEDAMVSFGDVAVGRLITESNSGRGRTSERAARALARIGPNAVPLLIAALTGNDPAAAAGAAKPLGQLKPPEAIRPLIDACGGSQHHQMLAFDALSQYGEAARADLVAALNDDNLNGISRSTAAILLVTLGDRIGWPWLENDVTQGDRAVLNLVANRMGSTKSREFLPLLEKALARPEAEQTVAYSAAFCGGKDALPILEQALNHPNEGVRSGAKSWIERLTKGDKK